MDAALSHPPPPPTATPSPPMRHRRLHEPAPAGVAEAAARTDLLRPDVRGGDQIDGAAWATRPTAWGANGAAATAHPTATLIAIDMLKAGGSAVDAAIAANIALGFLEPIACGVGGDAFALLWDPNAREVVGLNGSGRSPASLSLET